LHRQPMEADEKMQYSLSTLTDAMLPLLAITLALPFPNDSCIILWQPRLRQYRAEQMAFLEALIASWRWHGGGLCRDIVENIVSEYALGGLKLREYRALDAEYVDPLAAGREQAAVRLQLRDMQTALSAMRDEMKMSAASSEAAAAAAAASTSTVVSSMKSEMASAFSAMRDEMISAVRGAIKDETASAHDTAPAAASSAAASASAAAASAAAASAADTAVAGSSGKKRKVATMTAGVALESSRRSSRSSSRSSSSSSISSSCSSGKKQKK
jgi:hypothetical protein